MQIVSWVLVGMLAGAWLVWLAQRGRRPGAESPPDSTPRRLPGNLAAALSRLDGIERDVLHQYVRRQPVTARLARQDGDTLGQRTADRVASFGGSWAFIGLFTAVLVGWIVINSTGRPFDPYPFILLNLLLSCIAAVQAPIILMSQNRQSEKDRQRAEEDFAVNMKAEMEILALHEKIDELRDKRWRELVAQQEQQIVLLERMLATRTPG
jgi:uncharacterized membrane protein